MELFYFRGAERIIIVLFGGMSIFLGYRLFSIYSNSKGSLNAEWKGWKLSLRDLAPGIYFSLFGTFILSVAINHTYSTGDLKLQSDKQSYLDRPLGKSRKEEMGPLITTLNLFEKHITTDGVSPTHNEMSSLTNNLASIRVLLAEAATNEGALEWYAEQKKIIDNNPKAFDNLNSLQQENYRWLQSFVP